MSRCVTSCFLIAVLITSNFSKLFIYAGFETNRHYIATRLCENRSRPMLHCNGQCYLAKKLKQEEQKEKSGQRQSQKNNFQEAVITQKMKTGLLPFFNLRLLPISLHFILPAHSAGIFHPPEH